VLRLVDDQDRERVDRRERLEELVQRVAQVGPRRAREPAAYQVVHRHDAELDEQHLQQVFARHERVWHERGERLAIERRQHRAAQRRLAGADLPRQHDETLAALNGHEDVVVHRGVRLAAIQRARVRGQAERLVRQAIVALVGQQARPAHARGLSFGGERVHLHCRSYRRGRAPPLGARARIFQESARQPESATHPRASLR
jgi:hypothetical protein